MLLFMLKHLGETSKNCTISRADNTLAQSPGKHKLIQGLPSYNISNTAIFLLKTSDTSKYYLNPELWDDMPSGLVLQIEWLIAKNLDFDFGEPFINTNSTFEAVTCYLYTSVREMVAQVEGGVYSESIKREVMTLDTLYLPSRLE